MQNMWKLDDKYYRHFKKYEKPEHMHVHLYVQ